MVSCDTLLALWTSLRTGKSNVPVSVWTLPTPPHGSGFPHCSLLPFSMRETSVFLRWNNRPFLGNPSLLILRVAALFLDPVCVFSRLLTNHSKLMGGWRPGIRDAESPCVCIAGRGQAAVSWGSFSGLTH